MENADHISPLLKQSKLRGTSGSGPQIQLDIGLAGGLDEGNVFLCIVHVQHEEGRSDGSSESKSGSSEVGSE